jgi:hypothetical protein
MPPPPPMPPPMPLVDVPSEVTVLLMVNVDTDVPLLHVPPSYHPFQLSVLELSVPPDDMVYDEPDFNADELKKNAPPLSDFGI